MEFNKLGIIFFVLPAAAAVISVIILFCFNNRKERLKYPLISRIESDRFLKESIAIQPSNSRLFENRTVNMVINDGMENFAKDHYSMLKGVNPDV